MKVGDLEFNDTQGYLYFLASYILFLIAILVIVWMAVLLRKEFKESYIDLLRVCQYILVFIDFSGTICSILWECWYAHVNEILLSMVGEAFFLHCVLLLHYKFINYN